MQQLPSGENHQRQHDSRDEGRRARRGTVRDGGCRWDGGRRGGGNGFDGHQRRRECRERNRFHGRRGRRQGHGRRGGRGFGRAFDVEFGDDVGKAHAVGIAQGRFADGLAVDERAVGGVQVFDVEPSVEPGDFGMTERNRRVVNHDGIAPHPTNRNRIILQHVRHRRQTGKLNRQRGHTTSLLRVMQFYQGAE